jgi:hypothetical protein
MEEDPENGKESSHSAYANGMYEWINESVHEVKYLWTQAQPDGLLWWHSIVLQIRTNVTAKFDPLVVKYYINVQNDKDLLELLAGLHIAWQLQYHFNSLNQRIKSPSLQPNALLKRHKTSKWIMNSWHLWHTDESVIVGESIIWIMVPL